jgi:hypothetical protein
VSVHAGQHDYVNASLSASSMVPFGGWLPTTGKWTDRAVDLYKVTDDLAPAAGNGERLLWTSWQNYPKVADGERVYAESVIVSIPTMLWIASSPAAWARRPAPQEQEGVSRPTSWRTYSRALRVNR